MAATPIMITLYDENDEIKGEYSRLIVPWSMLKKSMKLSSQLGKGSGEDTLDAIIAFVCELFGNKFTAQELEDGADISEIYSVIHAVQARAAGNTDPNA